MAILRNRQTAIALLAIAAIVLHLVLRFATGNPISQILDLRSADLPLVFALVVGGLPLIATLLGQVARREFGADLLAGISIVTSAALGEYLAGALVVLMLSGGQALEAYAVRSASSVLEALAKRMPSIAHLKEAGGLRSVDLAEVGVGSELVVLPHETCPVDGVVFEGRGVMDESYLTGEPYLIKKTPGSTVLSGAINGDAALSIRATKLAVDSRYAKIMEVMRTSEQKRPQIRRVADQLGAWYTPLAVVIAAAAWIASGDPIRFLSVLVVATPCPLLIAIPVAVIGSISLAAKRGIIIKDPAVLEKIDTCTVAIFDKTGTLTYGEPHLVEVVTAEGTDRAEVLALTASLEQYSKHPLSGAIVEAAKGEGLTLQEAAELTEPPGAGLTGRIGGRTVVVTGRSRLTEEQAVGIPPHQGGMECVVLLDGRFAALFRFRDEPRSEGASFVRHLSPKHGFKRIMIVSGDRESEVSYLAEKVGITEVYASQSPEQKLDRVRALTEESETVFLGDGINDAPALTAATVGIAFGQHSDITAEASGAVVLESSLEKVDVLMHVGRRMRAIGLQSAIGGMALSVGGMLVAATGYLPPVAGAVSQELIDIVVVVNALRAAFPPKALTDY